MNQRHKQRGPSRLMVILLPVALFAANACVPGGPSQDELFAEPVFATVMPGASEEGRGGVDAGLSVEGRYQSYATRMLVSPDDEDSVLAWHRAAYEAAGWMSVSYAYIWMYDGRPPQNAWRRGDLVLGFGFPIRDDLNRAYPEGTLYEVTITYRPEASSSH